MDSGRVMLHVLVLMMICCLSLTWARVASSLPVGEGEDGEGGVEMGSLPDSFFSAAMNAKRNNKEDISKLLLKSLRFRQLPETASDLSAPEYSHTEKRQEQRTLVNNLAALLSGLRDRQVESSMRMPSLRFGK